MKRSDIIRAWRDPEFRASLGDDERAGLPAHPAADLSEDELGMVAGGANKPHTWRRTWCGSCSLFTLRCCGGPMKL